MSATIESPSAARLRGVCARSRAIAAGIALVGVCQAAQASAPARVSVLGDSACPDAADVARELGRSLVDTDVSTQHYAGSDVVTIVDQGDQYTVAARDEARTIVDVDRNCTERARVAAVFAAMTLEPPVIETPAEPVASTLPSKPSSMPPADLPPNLQSVPRDAPSQKHSPKPDTSLSVGLLTTWAGSSDQPWALGPEVGVGLTRGLAGLHLGAALTTPSTLRFGDVRAQLVRLPVHVSAYVRGRGSVVEGAMGLGLAVEGLHVSGRGDFTPHTANLVQMGLRLAAQGRFHLGEGHDLFCELAGTFVPSTYELAVAPEGVVGSTPALWLGVTLGGSMELH